MLWGTGLPSAAGCGGFSMLRGFPPLWGAGLSSAVGCRAPLCCGVRGSSLLWCAGLLYAAGCGAPLHCGVWGLLSLRGVGRSGFPWGGARATGTWASAATACRSGLVVQGLQSTGSEVAAHRFSCSAACGISPGQGLNLCPLHGLVDSYPRDRQGRP